MVTINEHKASPPQLMALLEDKRLEISELKSEIEMLRNIIALIPGNVYWKGEEKTYLGCNNNLAQILGFSSPKEIIGKQNSDLMGPELAQLTDQVDMEVYTTGQEKYVEEHGLNVDREPAI